MPHAGERDDRSTPGDPREVLRRLVALALGDETSANLTIAVALRVARRKTLPRGRHELLAFVERHLHGELRDQLGPRLAAAVLDDLAAALDERPMSEPAPDMDEGAERHERATMRAPDAVPPVAAKPVRQAVRIEDDARSTATSARRAVLVIDADRIARVDLSRALIRADCEVTVRDSCSGAMRGADGYDVIVTDIDGVAIDELIEAFVENTPSCAVIAWTKRVDRARAMFRAAGLDTFSVVPKESRPDAVVAAVDGLLKKRASVAP
jgi:hypothetical protein